MCPHSWEMAWVDQPSQEGLFHMWASVWKSEIQLLSRHFPPWHQSPPEGKGGQGHAGEAARRPHPWQADGWQHFPV